MSRYLVTGSHGFIGQHVCTFLYNQGHEITIVSRSKVEQNNKSNYEVFFIDDLESEVFLNRFDAIIHLAWGGSRRSERNNIEIQISNFEFTKRILKLMNLLNIKKIISFGSQAEYGNIEKVKKDSQFNPLNEYGIYKVKAKKLIKEFCETNNYEWIWFRLFSIYGTNDFENTLITSTINKMLVNDSIDLTLCIQRWDFLNIKDVCSLVNKALLIEHISGDFNVAFGESYPLKHYIEILKEMTNTSSSLNFGAIPYGKEGIINLDVNINDTKQTFNWIPMTTFKKGIEEIIEEVLHNEKN